jgi:DedD protein
MEEKNELNDIILNKGSATNSNKKIILAIATLGVILIIVVMLMNSLNSNGTDNLPQVALPPEPQSQTVADIDEEPLFEEVEVIEESPENENKDLTQIAQKLKEESMQEEIVVETPVVKQAVEKQVVKKKTAPKAKKQVVKKKTTPKATSGVKYFIQVGSFSTYEPNKKFLGSIKKLGYNYEYHKVGKLNKVLVGPFKTSNEAKNARRTLRAKVEPGAFLVKL